MTPRIAIPAELEERWRDAARDAGCDVVDVPADPHELAPADREPVVGLLAAELPLPRIDALVDALPSLEWIHVTSAGIDRLDVRAWRERGLVLTNSSGCYDIPMAEHVIACLLAAARQLLTLSRRQRDRHWSRAIELETLAHSTVTIVGLGSIGAEVARLAKAFRCRVEAVRRSPRGRRAPHVDRVHGPDDLDRALKVADHVVVTLPLTAATRGLFDASRFERMKPGASFVNVGRGALVDEEALLAGLENGRPGTAWLDVFAVEPLPAEHPFWTHERVFVSPHVSWRAPRFDQWLLDLWAKNCARVVAAGGRPLDAKLINRRDLEAGY